MHEPRVEQTLSQVLRKRVERWGDKPWIVAGDRALTYGEVDALSNRLANGLAAAGIGAGRTVLIMLPSTPDFVTVWCALAKLGAIEVPVNTHLKAPFSPTSSMAPPPTRF